MIRWAVTVFLALVAAILEVAATPFLPAWLQVRPLMPLLVLCVIGSSPPRAVATAVVSGVLVDIFSYAAFGVATFRLVLLVFLLDLVSRHWLTNRSLYAALAMAILARFTDWGSAWITQETAYALHFHSYPPVFWRQPWITLAWDVALVGLGFVALALFSNRFSLSALQKGTSHV